MNLPRSPFLSSLICIELGNSTMASPIPHSNFTTEFAARGERGDHLRNDGHVLLPPILYRSYSIVRLFL